ncbi:hypothetical protein KAJ27_07885 [bacterium]|nr:hypothetical protein [bacterium]
MAYILHTERPFTANAFALRNFFIELDPKSKLADMVIGNARSRFNYPRIQFSVVKQQPIIIGVDEGIEIIAETLKNLQIISIAFINWMVEEVEEVYSEANFDDLEHIYNYEFLNPWVALSGQHLGRYKYFYGAERVGYLNKILNRNIIFIIKEFQNLPEYKVINKIRLNGLKPMIAHSLNAGMFTGDFQVNIKLPNYIGMGNAISKGYGTIRLINTFREKAPRGTDEEVNGNLIVSTYR